MAHLTMLQHIADANGGNRAVGTPGYDASVDYVADALRSKGFDVQTPEFVLQLPFADPPEVTVDGTKVDAKPLEYTVGTPSQGVTGPLVAARVEDSPGCTAADYDGLAVTGAVVLVDRGSCPFGDKQLAAAARGAVALIVADNFRLADTPRQFRDLDEWFRRRMRQIRWKEWKRARTRVARLRALGIRADLARKWGMTGRGYWRIAGSPILTRALPNQYWTQQGLITFHHARGPIPRGLANRRMRGPHVRWCERGPVNPAPYSIGSMSTGR